MKRMWTAPLAGAALAVAMAGAVEAASLKLLTSWNKNNWPTYAVLQQFLDNAKEIGGDTVTFTISGPEVVPPFEQLQPVASGVFDMLYTHGVYHSGSKGIALVVDTIDMNPLKRREVGIWDFVDKYYQKHNNLKLVGLPAQSFSGYHMFLKEPLSPEGDVKGRKIRGTLSYHGVIRALGGSPVVLPGSQIYTALEKGVVDGACWPAAGMLSMKHFEVAKYRVRPTFGSSNEPILINLDSWAKLNDKEKGVLLAAGRETELEMPWVGREILADETRELDKFGVKTLHLPPDKAALVKKAWSESLWDVARKCCGDGADDLYKLAKNAGMTD
ncbi:MAG: TRAP transporter substrate-binding protein DctP [Defluviicoccus sp.]|nr:TRAP transporter substrate-binding protein DctP [Defluviicoccus sp.]MDE0382997.1 TRAP transporter substrate-binding protein DctP [Defluviicoccus sp.]